MREAVEREKADGDAEHLDRLAAPAGGQHLEDHREQQDQHHALPEVGQAEAEDGAAHDRLADDRIGLQAGQHAERHARSEEHTSELQSLMRISYAVFCLKKKKTQQQYTDSSLTNTR